MMLKLQGLLQIRGEIKKSDTVAALLATKAVQSMVAETRFLLMDRLDVEVQMLEDFKIIWIMEDLETLVFVWAMLF